MFNLTKESGLVKVWVSLVMSGIYTVEQVPAIFGLDTLVKQVVTELTATA